jgi:hypothetical protein
MRWFFQEQRARSREGDETGQGPYRIEAAALGAKFGEQIEVTICAPRSLQGDYTPRTTRAGTGRLVRSHRTLTFVPWT